MKSKKQNKNIIIAILSIFVALATIFTFVPMTFGDTSYLGVWGAYGMSAELYGGLYAEYDIKGTAKHDDIVSSMAKIKSTLQEQGYQSSNVISIDDSKIRVEIGYPTTNTEEAFSDAYKVLNNVAIGAFEFRSSQSETDEKLVRVTGKDHIKEISVADYNSTTYLVIEFNKSGEKQFESLCEASSTVYVYMGDTLQTSFSASNVTDYSQMQLSVTSFESAQDFYYKTLFGSLSVELNSDTVVINTMTSYLGLGVGEGASVALYVLAFFEIAILIAAFIFFAVKYKMMSVLLMPLMLLNLVIAGWVFSAITNFEINVVSLFALAISLAFVFGCSLMQIGRIKEEYSQGKTIDASIEAGIKKAMPTLIAASVTVIVISALVAIWVGGQITIGSIILIVFACLNILTNIVLFPWVLKLYNLSNNKQGLPYGFKQEDNTNV